MTPGGGGLPPALSLLVGPPGSGKTTRLLAEARAAASEGARTWWVGLPAQRGHVLRAATREGPLLGLEFLTPQQVAYRLLSNARRLHPLLTGTGRLALVGEALMEDRDDPPSPGEARLFARAIAEAKRHDVPAGRLPGRDDETARLRRVFHAYERLKADAWDYDDFRREAVHLLEEGPPAAVEPDRVFVDGLREIGPMDLRLMRALARHAPVRMALALAPPHMAPDETLPPRDDVEIRAHHFANPVAEARWVLRDVKAELAAGADPLDLALIVPEGSAPAYVTLAEEFGVPLMDETPRSATDRPEGRRLLDLLELPDHPTASRLLAVPALHALGVAALDAGVAGRDAITRLADAHGHGAIWREWLARLEVPPEPRPWAEALVDEALDAARAARGAERGTRTRAETQFRELALQRLGEARRVAHGPHVRDWWAALLQDTTPLRRPEAGVALLTQVQASGRRFAHAWVAGAREGAYGSGEREDYFVPEEARSLPERAYRAAVLPRRFQGRDAGAFAELRTRGDVTRVSYPRGDQGGRVAPEPALVGDAPEAAPVRPAGSRLEGPGRAPYRPPEGPVDLGPPRVEALGRYARCPFRAWAEARLGARDEDEPPAWVRLVRDLRARSRWTAADLRALAPDHPEAAAWLDAHADTLAGFTFGVHLRDEENGAEARLDAARREDGRTVLVRFTAPGEVATQEEARAVFERHGREAWAAAHLLRRHAGALGRLQVWAWPLSGPPVPALPQAVRRPDGVMARTHRQIAAAVPGWRAGDVRPTPGFVCRDCLVYDVCREGRR
ncbi:MAG: hypothetical protein U5K81_00990 [Trueperaceae bacterium]|nr:hypothetical protein [Trueperaceae bacterium]